MKFPSWFSVPHQLRCNSSFVRVPHCNTREMSKQFYCKMTSDKRYNECHIVWFMTFKTIIDIGNCNLWRCWSNLRTGGTISRRHFEGACLTAVTIDGYTQLHNSDRARQVSARSPDRQFSFTTLSASYQLTCIGYRTNCISCLLVTYLTMKTRSSCHSRYLLTHILSLYVQVTELNKSNEFQQKY